VAAEDTTSSARPVGVFDSGIGGLSVLRALKSALPHERFVYLADSGHAPYGERDAAHVVARSQAVTRHLLEQHGIKALVMACNTATAAAVHLLRAQYPALPIIGVEPALKPATALSSTKQVGVLATRGTLASAKFQALLQGLADKAQFHCRAADGLADALERGEDERAKQLCRQHVQALGCFGAEAGQMDTLVLGCTHYPFAQDALQAAAGVGIRLIESGEPVARQTQRVLANARLLAAGDAPCATAYLTTGQAPLLAAAVQRWLGEAQPAVQALAIPS
jgi:glutamate racemase